VISIKARPTHNITCIRSRREYQTYRKIA